MEIKRITINGREVEFVNQSRGTRTGFAHDTTVFIDGFERHEATCIYYNRTWERYTYQTVMRKAVIELRDRQTDYLKEQFKAENGYQKLTAKRQEEFEAYRNGNEQVQFYTAILKELE